MRDRECLVFVEVRYRTSVAFASPALTVDDGKQRRIMRTAESFIASRPQFADDPVRFDVIAIDRADSRPGTIQWIPDAFRS